jgi:hypothetical protein
MWGDEDGEAEEGAKLQGLTASEYKTPMELGQSSNFKSNQIRVYYSKRGQNTSATNPNTRVTRQQL